MAIGIEIKNKIPFQDRFIKIYFVRDDDYYDIPLYLLTLLSN
ncbi:hypothetical protein GMMP15_140033 [Candidatus Magnetomoraceae bacterium gMMP-15]